MAGALAERDFVEKMKRVGFTGIEIPHRHAFGVDQCMEYPLFTDDLIRLMRELLPADKQQEVATSIVLKARLPG